MRIQKKKQEFKWLNNKWTQTLRRPFYTPKPDADLCMRVDLPLDKKLWKITIGPLGRSGPRAGGPSARRAAGPSRAVGRGALGRGPVLSKTRITIVQNSTSRTELSAIANWKNVVNRVDFMKIPKKYCLESTILVNSVAPRSLPYCRKKNYTWLISLLQLPVAARNNRRFTGKYNIMTKSSIIL